jgi:hypothetical protein
VSKLATARRHRAKLNGQGDEENLLDRWSLLTERDLQDVWKQLEGVKQVTRDQRRDERRELKLSGLMLRPIPTIAG